MAGVTLIAFANGAGDIITAFVAAGSPDGISYNIGSLYGAALFVSSTVIAFTILQNKSGIVKIAFPIINTNWEEDGISHLLCQLMG